MKTDVNIVVKATNQPVADQTIQCKLQWSVRRLKKQLSDVHPIRPPISDQRLIYSGQLLHDRLLLKEFLKTYDEHTVHTIHMVCPSPSETPSKTPSQTHHSSVVTQQPTATGLNTSGGSGHTDMDQPNTQPLHQELVYGQAYQYMQAVMYSQTLQGTSWSHLNAEQLAWIQRTYGQFMMNYLQYYQQTAQVAAVSGGPPQTAAPPAQRAADPPAGNGNVQMNAQGGHVDMDEEDMANRDWLDWFYVFTRAVVLFSIVYFYSSLGRFIMVTVLATLFYMYQVGWLRRQQGRRRRNLPVDALGPNEGRGPPADNIPHPPAGDEAAEQQRLEQMMDADMDDAAAGGVGAASMLWTIVITFFSSLVPDQPNQQQVD